MGVIQTLFAGGIKDALSGLGDSVKNAVSAFKADPTKIAELDADLSKAVQAHEEKMTELSNTLDEAYLKDVDSARQMQIEALKQNDLFSKRFVYYLAAGIIILTFIYDFCFFKISYPQENRDIINMIAGVLNTSCLVMIVTFFFGSSQGSAEKQKRMDAMVDKMMDK